MTKDEVKAFNDARERAGKKRLLYPGDPEWDSTWKESGVPGSPVPPAPQIEPRPAAPAEITRTAGMPLTGPENKK